MARQIKRGNKFTKTKCKRNFDNKGNDEKKEFSKSNELGEQNDFKWYNLNPTLIEMAARIPFGRPLGNTVGVKTKKVSYQGAITDGTSASAVPGIITYYMVGSIGSALDGVQTIDTASKSIYSWVRHANSGHSNYDAPDLTIYLLSAKEIYGLAGFMVKILAALQKWDTTNRYYGDQLLVTMGLTNIADWRANYANFRYFCAQWWKKAQSLYTPKSLPMFEKAFWMYTQIFEEDKTGKSGLYQYVPYGFYKYNPTKYTTGGCLEYTDVTASTFADFVAYATSLLDPLINDEDMGIMSGDIKKAFGDNVWKLADFPYEVSLQPVRDSFVLQQMHNTHACPVIRTSGLMDIVQDASKNEILWFPRFQASTNYDSIIPGFDNHLIDIDAEIPTCEQVIEATQYVNNYHIYPASSPAARLTAYAGIVGTAFNANKDVIPINCSDYMCVNIVIRLMTGPTAGTSQSITDDVESVTSGSNTVYKIYKLATYMAPFEFAPIVIADTNLPALGSLHNYTLVENATIANMHDASWLSLLAIPAQEHLK